jgi:hypothetical protein
MDLFCGPRPGAPVLGGEVLVGCVIAVAAVVTLPGLSHSRSCCGSRRRLVDLVHSAIPAPDGSLPLVTTGSVGPMSSGSLVASSTYCVMSRLSGLLGRFYAGYSSRGYLLRTGPARWFHRSMLACQCCTTSQLRSCVSCWVMVCWNVGAMGRGAIAVGACLLGRGLSTRCAPAVPVGWESHGRQVERPLHHVGEDVPHPTCHVWQHPPSRGPLLLRLRRHASLYCQIELLPACVLVALLPLPLSLQRSAAPLLQASLFSGVLLVYCRCSTTWRRTGC